MNLKYFFDTSPRPVCVAGIFGGLLAAIAFLLAMLPFVDASFASPVTQFYAAGMLLTLLTLPLGYFFIIRPLQRVSQEREGFSQAVLESIDQAILISDQFGDIVSCHGKTESILGATEDDLIGQQAIKIVPVLDEFFDLASQQDAAYTNRSILNKSGERIVVDIKVRQAANNRDRGWVIFINEKTQQEYQRRIYHTVLDSINHQTGDEFFAAFVEQMGRAFGARFAAVGLLNDEHPRSVSTLAFSIDGVLQPNLHYELKGTPCSNTIANGVCEYTENVHRLFPEDAMLTECGIESYFGIGLKDANGKVIGLINAMDTEKAIDRPEYRELLQVFAARCSAELQRLQATRKLEEAIEEKERANRSKDLFFANMSHEIRTPLSAILGYADCLNDDKLSHAERTANVAIIRRNGEHLLALINDILNLSKMESGQLQLERIAFSPQEVLDDVATMMKIRAESKGLSLHVESREPLPKEIESDPTRLRQIIINLVANAVKFTDSGSITIGLESCEGEGSPTVRFSVTDTGIGIQEKNRDRIFEVFTQEDKSTTRKFGGTGLGLAVSQRLVEMLGGDLTVDSEPGRGTRFEFQLPIVAPWGSGLQVRPRSIAERQSPAGLSGLHKKVPQSRRILIAEDHQDNKKLFGYILQNAGFDVVMVENGEDACREVEQAEAAGQPFDAVLMDMQMPVLDGYEATEQLRQRNPELPIIALTAYAMMGDREKCLDAGCTDFATKPIDRRQLVGLVNAHTDTSPTHGVV